MVRGISTRIFYVTGGFDTHSAQNPANGTYANLMTTLNDGLLAFYTDLNNQGLLTDTLVCRSQSLAAAFRRTAATAPTGAASVMLAMGSGQRWAAAGAQSESRSSQPTLENNAGDVHFQTDFRSVYSQVIEQWLGADSREHSGATSESRASRSSKNC
jgi:uncharacterized protein (DUF1501 family)